MYKFQADRFDSSYLIMIDAQTILGLDDDNANTLFFHLTNESARKWLETGIMPEPDRDLDDEEGDDDDEEDTFKDDDFDEDAEYAERQFNTI